MTKNHILECGHILDHLVDGPSSFAALYGGIVRQQSQRVRLPVREVFQVVETCVIRGWLRTALSNPDGSLRHLAVSEKEAIRDQYVTFLDKSDLEVASLSWDSIGLWIEITPKGRQEWKKWSGEPTIETEGIWTVDDEPKTRTLTVMANTAEAADEALREYAASQPGLRILDDTRTTSTGQEFRTRTGKRVPNGIRLTCRYTKAGRGPALAHSEESTPHP